MTSIRASEDIVPVSDFKTRSRVEWTEQAMNDVEGTAAYVAHEDRLAAQRWTKRIFAAGVAVGPHALVWSVGS